VTIRVFLNERETRRYHALESRVSEIKTLVENPLPEQRLKITVFNREYPTVIDDMFHDLQVIPRCIFSFIDPYGYKDNTFEAVRKLLSPQKGEVLVFFCAFRIAKVNESSGRAYKEHVANVFGLPVWTPQLRADVNSYRDQLQKCAGAKYTLHFSMRDNRDRRMYELVYAMKDFGGLKVMKTVMYSISQELDHEMQDFEFHFSDFKTQRPERGDTQNTMSDQAHKACAECLYDHFQGKETTLMEIEEHVLLRTAYPYFIGTLKAAAASRFILSAESQNGGRRPKWNTFESSKIRFASHSQLADDLASMLHNAADEARRLRKVEDFVEYAKFTWLGLAYTVDEIWTEVRLVIEDLHRQGKIICDMGRFSKAAKPGKLPVKWTSEKEDVRILVIILSVLSLTLIIDKILFQRL
jgi:three-Cys-motif partner protein